MKKFTVSFLIFLFPFLLPAQQLYSGDYTFNGLKGEGVFEFIQGKNQEVIKHGNFQFPENKSIPLTILFSIAPRSLFNIKTTLSQVFGSMGTKGMSLN